MIDLDHPARRYHQAGWHPLELPARAKTPPRDGLTGHDGIDMTAEEIDASAWAGNIGLRMPDDVIGLDVDVYHGGDRTLADLSDRLGKLPRTWISHSGRNDDSGIRLFRVPAGRSWIHKLPGIEIIQRTHRYAMVWPSIHPEGRRYEWFDQTIRGPAEVIPAVDDLPMLPPAWVEELSRNWGLGVATQAASAQESDEFVDAHVVAEAPGYIANSIVTYFREYMAKGYSRHDTMTHCLIWAMECVRAGIAAAKPTVQVFADLWVEVMHDDPRRAELWSDRRVTEFEAMLRHAIGKAQAKPQAEIHKLHDDIAGIRMNVPERPPAPVTSNGDQDQKRSPGRSLTLCSVETTKPRRVRWLWDGRVPLGVITLLGGREGIGKSILAYTLAARITRGSLEGEFYGQARSVVVVATEDSWEHTIIPRLIVAGADLTRIERLTVTASDGRASTLAVPQDIEGLHQATVGADAALVMLDPIISRLDASLDTHRDAEVRQGLEPLSDSADRGRYSILGLIHVNKGTSNDPLTMLMASRAFAAVARAVLFTTLDPEQPGMRLLGEPKNNLGRTDLPTLMFDIAEEVAGTDPDDGIEITTGKLRWAGVSQRTILDALHDAARSPDARDRQREAEDWLRDYLSANPVASSKDVKKAGADEGHAERTLKRAKERIGAGVTSIGFPRRTVWSAPGMTPDEVEKVVASWAMGSDQIDAD